MATVSPVLSLNIEGQTLQVADLGPKVQALVTVYNSWNQKLTDAHEQFSLVQAALNDLSRQIMFQVKQDEADAKAAAEAAAASATPVAVTTPDVAPVASDVPVASTDAPVTTPTAKE